MRKIVLTEWVTLDGFTADIHDLKLKSSKTFKSGVVFLTYNSK